MTEALIAIFEDAPASLHAAARQLAAGGAEVLTLQPAISAQESEPAAGDMTPELQRDWVAVLARSHRIDRSDIDRTEQALTLLVPAANELVARADGRPLILLGRAAAAGALALTGSYVAVHGGGTPDQIDLIGYRHADSLLTTGTPAISEDLSAEGIVPIGSPVEPDTASLPASITSQGIDAGLLILAAAPLNPDVSFAILEALALLNVDPSKPATLVAPTPLPDPDFIDWAIGLGVGDQLVMLSGGENDPATLAAIAQTADVTLATANNAEGVVQAIVSADAGATGVASMFDHPVALALVSDAVVHTGAGPGELAAAITAAAKQAGRHPESSIIDAATIATIERARQLADAPGSSFRAVRQKQWELIYEGESADGYDSKYHDAACYVDLDRALAAMVADALPTVDRTRRILDLGCGPGSMVPFLQEIDNVEIVGVDVSPAMLRHARDQYPDVTFELGNTDALLFDDETFDVVLVSGVLHHLPVLRTTLDEIRRVLVAGGSLVAREPNEDNLGHRHPLLSFAHQGLRSLVLDHFGHRPQYEPEAHDDHIDFTPAVLADAIATVFAVERVATAGVVSYFHDTLDRQQQSLVAELETTASSQPGLNLFVVGQKTQDVGITPAASAWLRDFAETRPIAADHVDALIDAFKTMLSLDPPARRTIEEQLTRVLSSMTADALILSEGGFDHQTVGRVDLLAPGDASADLVSVAVSGSSPPETLEIASSRVRDHGWLVVDLDADATPALAAETAGLTAVGLEPTTSGHRVLARRHPLGPHDVVVALENLLADAGELIEPVTAERIDGWHRQVDEWRAIANFAWPTSSFVRLAPLSETVAALLP